MARPKKPDDTNPDRLKRERAGRYVTPDGRFTLEGDGTGSWYLADNERHDELGMPLLVGPLATLDEAHARIATLRVAGTQPAPPAAGTSATASGPGTRTKQTSRSEAAIEPTASSQPTAPSSRTRPPKPSRRSGPTEPSKPAHTADPSWLERISPERRDDARHLMATLERIGLNDSSIVRREIEANLPEVARALLARRVRKNAVDIWLDPGAVQREFGSVEKGVKRHLRPKLGPALDAAERVLAGEGSPGDAAALAWLVALRTAGAIFDAIEGEGDMKRIAGQPGWRLVELDGRREPTNRAVIMDASDLMDGPDA